MRAREGKKSTGVSAAAATPAAGLLRRMRRSLVPDAMPPSSDRDRALLTRFTFVLHLRPVQLPAATLRWTHTFGLGGSALVLFLLLVLTGGLSMLVYQPVPASAWDSVLSLERQVAFGSLVRGMHHWSANLLVLVALLHTARVFLTGAYRGERAFNWVIGCALLGGVLAAAFTGYLLPWDQLSYWAVTISTGMLAYVPGIGETLQAVARGGGEVGAGTLTVFYTLHTTAIPVALAAAMGWHFWRVRRAGGVINPSPPPEAAAGPAPGKVLFLPNLLAREASQALAVVALVMLLAALFAAPLGSRANPGMSPNPAKAPWYFMGLQELLIHLHPAFAVLVLPLAAALALLLLPYLVPAGEPAGRWLLTPAGRRGAALAAVLAAVATPLLVVLDDRLGRGAAHWLSGGLLPVALVVVVSALFGWWVRRRLVRSAAEAVQAVVVLLATGFTMLTVIGIWFRGEGMALMWPWQT